MARILMEDSGAKKIYYNEHWRPHREDGPAVIQRNGHKRWWINGIETAALRVDGRFIQWHHYGDVICGPNGIKQQYKSFDGGAVWPEL